MRNYTKPIEDPSFTDEELEDMAYWNVDPDTIVRCAECHRTVYHALDECRYCDTRFAPPKVEKSSEQCDICANDLLWDSDSEEWYCPMSHSVFDL